MLGLVILTKTIFIDDNLVLLNDLWYSYLNTQKKKNIKFLGWYIDHVTIFCRTYFEISFSMFTNHKNIRHCPMLGCHCTTNTKMMNRTWTLIDADNDHHCILAVTLSLDAGQCFLCPSIVDHCVVVRTHVNIIF